MDSPTQYPEIVIDHLLGDQMHSPTHVYLALLGCSPIRHFILQCISELTGLLPHPPSFVHVVHSSLATPIALPTDSTDASFLAFLIYRLSTPPYA